MDGVPGVGRGAQVTQDYEQTMGNDEERPEATTDGHLDEFIVDVPAGDEEHPISLRELQEAVEDESHPRHAWAVQRNKELAEQIKPAIERLQQTMFEQSGLRESLARIQETVAKATTVSVPRADLPKFGTPKLDITNPMIEQNQRWQHTTREQQEGFERVTTAIVEARAERQRLEEQRAEQTLEVLTLMEAHLVQLNNRIQNVDARIEAGNTTSSKVAGWTILVAVLTLLATVAGTVVRMLPSR